MSTMREAANELAKGRKAALATLALIDAATLAASLEGAVGEREAALAEIDGRIAKARETLETAQKEIAVNAAQDAEAAAKVQQMLRQAGEDAAAMREAAKAEAAGIVESAKQEAARTAAAAQDEIQALKAAADASLKEVEQRVKAKIAALKG